MLSKFTDGLGGVFVVGHILLGADDFDFHVRAHDAPFRLCEVAGSYDLQRF